MLSEQQKKMLVGGFIAFIMVFSIFGFVLNYSVTNTANTYEYLDHTFKATQDGYTTTIDDIEYTFYLLPSDVDSYAISEAAKSLLGANAYAVTYDPKAEYPELLAEAQYIFEQGLNVKITRGLTDNNGTALPNITCADGTSDMPVIYFTQANETQITHDGACIKAQFLDQYDLLRQEELLRYLILGVIA